MSASFIPLSFILTALLIVCTSTRVLPAKLLRPIASASSSARFDACSLASKISMAGLFDASGNIGAFVDDMRVFCLLVVSNRGRCGVGLDVEGWLAVGVDWTGPTRVRREAKSGSRASKSIAKFREGWGEVTGWTEGPGWDV